MNFSFETDIEVKEEYDVIVVGGGPAGSAAAIASARTGAKTLLIESNYALGGMGTLGLVPAWCPYSDHEKIIYKGIAEEIFDEMKQGMFHINNSAKDWVAIDKELLKRIYEQKVEKAGVEILFGTQIINVVKNGKKIEYLVGSNKNGLVAFKGKMYIDCSGDADLFEKAGLPFDFGDDTSDTQPSTLCFIVSNVDEYYFTNGPSLHPNNKESYVYKIIEDPKYDLVEDGHMCSSLVGPRTVGFNAGHLWRVDPTDPLNVTKNMIRGRKLVKQLHDGLKEYYPEAFAASYLVDTAEVLGVRESRRIKGKYTITKDDYINRVSFPDEIGRNCYFLDIHKNKEVQTTMAKNKADAHGEDCRMKAGESHGIPFSCLITEDMENLITAGKTISSDRAINGSLRVMPPCLVTGQAAGTAAAMAKDIGNIHELNIQSLREKLKEDGAYFS